MRVRVEVIIVGTVTPDMMFPSTACLVQDKIGAKGAWGFDVSAGCSGFVFALQAGVKLVESGAHKKVLVIGADANTRMTDYTDRTTCVLFGDGGGAVLIEPAEEGEIGFIDFVQRDRRVGRREPEPEGRRQPESLDATRPWTRRCTTSTRTVRRCTSLRCARWPRLRRRCWSAMA